MKYHVNPENGKVSRCAATVQTCKFASDGQVPKHYENKETAREAVEKVLTREFGATASLTKNSVPIGTPKNMAPEGWDSNDYDDEGYDREGYDADGYGRDGYNSEGYDQNGFDRNGFDEDGFSNKGDFADTAEISQRLSDEAKGIKVPAKPNYAPTVHEENVPPRPTEKPTVSVTTTDDGQKVYVPPKPKNPPTI